MGNALYRPTALVLLTLAILTLIVYHRVLFAPGVTFGQDTLIQGFPLAVFESEALKLGHHPSWFPYMLSGFPMTNPAPFYPTDWLLLIMPVGRAITWSYILHTFAAAGAMFLLLRRFERSISASTFGAIAFAFSGTLISKVYAGHSSALWSGIWIPLTLLFVDKLLETRQSRYAVYAGAVMGLQILGQHPQYVYYTAIAITFYSLWRILSRRTELLSLRQIPRIIGLAAILILFAAAISAPFLLPFAQMSGLSNRADGTGYEFASSLSAHPAQLITPVAPSFWGSPVTRNSVFGALYWDASIYIGVIPFLLSLIALFKVRDNRAKCFKWLAVVSIPIALGSHTPIFRIIYMIPGFSMMRAPSKILFLYAFSASVLAAYGMDLILSIAGRRLNSPEHSFKSIDRQIWRLPTFLLTMVSGMLAFWIFGKSKILSFAIGMVKENRPNDPESLAKIIGLYRLQELGLMWAVVLIALAIVIFLALSKKRITARTAAIVLTIAAFLDLAMYARPMLYTVDGPALYSQADPDVTRFLRSDTDQFRILPMDVDTFNYADGVFTGMESINGYYPLSLHRYARYVGAVHGVKAYVSVNAEMWEHESKLVGLLNTKYVLSDRPLSGKHLVPTYHVQTYIYQNRNCQPRAFTVHNAEIVPSENESFNIITGKSFNPRQTIAIESRGPAPMPSPAADSPDKVTITTKTNEEIKITADMRSNGYLFLGEVYYPTWEATLDSQPTKIYPADYLFRAVFVPRGHHEVRMVCKNRPYTRGAVLNILALFGLITTAALTRRRKKLEADPT